MERQKLIQILHDALPDKSRVKLQAKVDTIEQPPGLGFARVYTADGGVYEADLVVGADGVHSTTRSEIWKTTGQEFDRESALREEKFENPNISADTRDK